MSELSERLREAHPNSQQYANGNKILLEAADEITRLQAECEKLRARETKLVEALERIRAMDSMSYHSLESARIVAHAGLSAYRKGGETP